MTTPDADGSEDLDLGTAANVLLDDGKAQAAALLVDARIASIDYVDTGFPIGTDTPDEPIHLFAVGLKVPGFLIERFTDEVEGEIMDALNEVMQHSNIHITKLRVHRSIEQAVPDWRQRILTRLGPTETNQATVGPVMTDPIREDRCAFRSREELQVYRAFKRARDRRTDEDTLAIAPNPALVTRHTQPWEPDLMIAYRGRVGGTRHLGLEHRRRTCPPVAAAAAHPPGDEYVGIKQTRQKHLCIRSGHCPAVGTTSANPSPKLWRVRSRRRPGSAWK